MKKYAKTIKRIVAMALSVVMVVSLFLTDTLSASATEEGSDNFSGWLMDWAYLEIEACFNKDIVEMYKNPVTLAEDTITITEESQGVPETFVVQYRFTDNETGAAYYMLDTENWNDGSYANSEYGYISTEDVDFLVTDEAQSAYNTMLTAVTVEEYNTIAAEYKPEEGTETLTDAVLTETGLYTAAYDAVAEAESWYSDWTEMEESITGSFASLPVTLYLNPVNLPDDIVTVTQQNIIDGTASNEFVVEYKFQPQDGKAYYLIQNEEWSLFGDGSAYGYVAVEDVAIDVSQTAQASYEAMMTSKTVEEMTNAKDAAYASSFVMLTETAMMDNVEAYSETLSAFSESEATVATDVVGAKASIAEGVVVTVLYTNPDAATEGFYAAQETEFPENFEILGVYTQKNGDVWYKISVDFTECCYIYAQHVVIVEETEQPEEPEQDIEQDITNNEAGVYVTVSGVMPQNAILSVEKKTVADVILSDFGKVAKDCIVGIFDIKVLNEDGTSWQPAEGENVDVVFDFTSLGLADGTALKIHHLHEDGTVTTSSHTLADGKVTVVVTGFSDFLTELDAKELYATAKFITDTPVVYYNPISTSYVTLANATAIPRVIVDFAITYNNVEYYFVIDDLKEYATGESNVEEGDESDFSFYGYVPSEYMELDIVIEDGNSGLTNTEVVVAEDIVDITEELSSIVDKSGMDAHDCRTSAYDISLHTTDTDDNGNTIVNGETQPAVGKPVTVTIPNAWDPEWGYTRVDVYHILDDATAIANAATTGTLLKCTDVAMLEKYAEEATLTNGGYVPYVVLSTADDTVILNADGSITFTTESFSTFIVNGASVGVNVTVQNGGGMPGETTTTTYSHTIYMTAGSSAVVNFGQAATLQSTIDNSGNKITSSGNSANHTIKASSDATVGQTATFTYKWTQSNGGEGENNTTTYTANIKVIVIDSSEVSKYTYLTNGVEHIQIDIEATAIVLGYNNDASTALNLSFTSSTNYTLTKVPDDSGVGYHYQLTYTANDTANTPVTITIRVDETASNLESGVMFADVDFEPTGISIKDGQISFDGYFPVGTKANPIKYSITVETTMSLTPNNSSTAQNVDVSLANTIDYWSAANECPGLGNYKGTGNHTTVVSGSGIDLSKFSTGTVLSDKTTAYVVYSSLTKQVVDYIFGLGNNLANKTYTFTISAKTNEESVFTPIDTISITVDSSSNPATTSLNTDASKYKKYLELLIDGDDTTTAIFKVEETSYNISGFTCTVELSQLGTDGTIYSTLTDGVFSFNQTYDSTSEVRIFSITLKCVNTYAEKISGLAITKELRAGSSEGSLVTTDTTDFTVKVTPVILDSETPAEGSGILAADQKKTAINTFNGGTYHYIQGTDTEKKTQVSPSGGTTDTAYGTITLTIQAGQTLTLTDLPTGTYKVVEVAGSNTTDYTYDTAEKSATLIEEKTTSVTITNIIKNGKLKISKVVNKAYTADVLPDDSFTFTVDVYGTDSSKTYSYTKYWANGTVLTTTEDANATGIITDGGTVTLKAGQYVIIDDLPLGAYTVTETQDADYTTSVTIGAQESTAYIATGSIVAATTSEVVFYNTYTKHLADLTITKTVEVPAGFTPSNEKFTFTVTYGSADPLNYTIYNVVAGGDTVDSSSTISSGGTLQLAHNQYAVIKDMPIGAYTVTETVNENYTTTVPENASGTLTASGAKVDFVNTAQKGSLSISKTVTAPIGSIYKEREFLFTVYIENAVAGTLSYTVGDDSKTATIGAESKFTITLEDGQTAIFENLPAGADYTVTEAKDADFTTTVSVNANTAVEGNVANGSISANSTESIAFVNARNKADLTITKKAGDYTTFVEGETFIFKVTNSDGIIMEVVIGLEDNGDAVVDTWTEKSITIKDLPIGTYIVEEDTSWGFKDKYRVSVMPESGSVVLSAEADGSVTITNTAKTDKWLTSEAYVENSFKSVVNTTTNN